MKRHVGVETLGGTFRPHRWRESRRRARRERRESRAIKGPAERSGEDPDQEVRRLTRHALFEEAPDHRAEEGPGGMTFVLRWGGITPRERVGAVKRLLQRNPIHLVYVYERAVEALNYRALEHLIEGLEQAVVEGVRGKQELQEAPYRDSTVAGFFRERGAAGCPWARDILEIIADG